MEEVEKELSKIVGMEELKSQLRKWSKGLLLDQSRCRLGLAVGPRGPFLLAFLGNPGTGKSMAAQVVANLLHMWHILCDNTMGEARYRYGTLFVDGAHTLGKGSSALEPIVYFMDQYEEDSVCIPMKRENEGIRRRVTSVFYFDDYSCEDLAKIIHLKMSNADKKSYYGLKLHEAVAAMIGERTSEEQRKERNGRLEDEVLVKAQENLVSRVDVGCKDAECLCTITSEDLLAGLGLLESEKGRPNKAVFWVKEEVNVL